MNLPTTKLQYKKTSRHVQNQELNNPKKKTTELDYSQKQKKTYLSTATAARDERLGQARPSFFPMKFTKHFQLRILKALKAYQQGIIRIIVKMY